MKLDLSFWKNASTRRKRLYTILAVFFVALILTIIGSYIPPSSQVISQVNNLNQTLNENKANNTLTEHIFLNNFLICLVMFIPIAGAALGFYILFNTGVALGGIASIQGYPPNVGLFYLVSTPVFWLEFAAYSIAMAESIWLFRRLTQGRWRELKWTAVSIDVCTGLLIVGAFVEAWLING